MRKLPALFCLLAAASAAKAQPEPPLEPVVPQWAQIEAVEVHASPGPALWRVTKGDSEVWILGMIGALPKGVTWNQQTLSDLLTGSRAVIVPARVKFDIFDAGWFLLGHCCSFFRLDNGKLDDVLAPPMRQKLADRVQSVGGNLKDYQGDEPLGAANRLNRDFTRKYDLNGDRPMDAVAKLADAKKIELQPAFRFDPMPIVREAVKLTPEQQRPCLDAAAEDAARMAEHGRAMGQAWAVGDIKGLKEHFAEPRMMDCIAAMVHAYGAVDQNRVPAFMAAIDAALDRPGKTIAVVGMGPLLRKGGVLEQLKAQHLTIEGPGD
ncbi:MAG TPA: TraB/GumN family protein [Rhizomicrobium sp.]|nr:TraB/GumN family protein [Rhizomicrobium sp.]